MFEHRARTLSVKACLKLLPALSPVAPAFVTAGAGALIAVPDSAAGDAATAAASLALEETAGAGAAALAALFGASAATGDGLPAVAAVDPPSSGAALWCGEAAAGAGEAAGDAPCWCAWYSELRAQLLTRGRSFVKSAWSECVMRLEFSSAGGEIHGS